MKKYTNDTKIILASDKAFNVIYKHQGYILLEDARNDDKDIIDTKLNKLTLDELRYKAKDLGIENYSKLKKSELIENMNEIEGV